MMTEETRAITKLINIPTQSFKTDGVFWSQCFYSFQDIYIFLNIYQTMGNNGDGVKKLFDTALFPVAFNHQVSNSII